MNLDSTKAFAEDKLRQALERLELRDSANASSMEEFDLDKAIEATKAAAENLEELREEITEEEA